MSDNFWNDETVKEFIEKWHGDRHWNEVINDMLPKFIDKFKRSKQSTQAVNTSPTTVTQVKDWEIESGAYANGIHQINKVRRLSDNCLFSINDEIEYWLKGIIYKGRIERFEINLGKLWVYGSPSNWYYPLEEIKKVKPKEKLFTTEDGVDIYDNMGYWAVSTINYLIALYQTNENHWWHYYSDKTFSTKEKAEEYILFNKPILNLNEILEVWAIGELQNPSYFSQAPLFQKIKQKAKSKINP